MAISGRWIRKIRQGLNLDQSRFGRLVGVSQRTVSGWESYGNDSIPRVGEAKIRRALKDKYGVSLKNVTEEGNEDLMAALGAGGAAAIAALTAGPLAAVIAAPFGARIGESFASENRTITTLEIKCPWCKKSVLISGVEEEIDYECGECRMDFKIKRGRGPIRVAQSPSEYKR